MLQNASVRTTKTYLKKAAEPEPAQPEAREKMKLDKALFSPLFTSWLREQLYASLRERLLRRGSKRDVVLLDTLWMLVCFQASAANNGGKVHRMQNVLIGEAVGDGTYALSRTLDWDEVERIMAKRI